MAVKVNTSNKLKYAFWTVSVVVVFAVGLFGWSYYQSYAKTQTQLNDVENKIEQLPEFEKDIFTKCMEGKEGTAQNIAQCQENTQENIHTLSQELINLKSELEAKSFWDMIQL